MARKTRSCPFCSESILETAIKCKHCGSMLTDTPQASGDSETFIKNALAARFEILEEIGRGGMSIVYKAVQKNLNRTVALKVLPRQFTHDKEFLARFHREAQATAQLTHPNIVTIFDEGIENGVHFMAMEYIDGEDLHMLIQRQGPLVFTEVKKWLVPIAEGLGYAHERNVIHRDVKSSNILIDEQGRAVLTDFGIARATESTQLTRTGTVLGTPEYMSPEQAKGEVTDARSDIYSLGVVMYQCLTGRLPFQSETILGTIHKITHDPPTPSRGLRADIPEKVENAVLRCLAKDSAERYQNCAALVQALEQGEPRRMQVKKTVTPAAKATAPAVQTTLNWTRVAIWTVSALFVIVIILMLKQNNQRSANNIDRDLPAAANIADRAGSTRSSSEKPDTPAQSSASARTVRIQALYGRHGNILKRISLLRQPVAMHWIK